MQDNKILASIAVFRELYNSEKDIYDIISEFLKAAIIEEGKWSFNTIEAKQLLKIHYDFNIPDAIVKTVIRKRLCKNEYIRFEDGLCIVDKKGFDNQKAIKDKYKEAFDSQNLIIESLIEYIQKHQSKTLTEEEKKELELQFQNFLLDSNIANHYSSLISSFVIENSADKEFIQKLNSVKEGIVIYTGVRYTGNLHELGSWTTDLTIFLDTEILFHAAGYNGEVYRQIFEDFFDLVNEINQSNRAKNKTGNIQLRIFSETKEEVEKFFFVAEKIIEGKASLEAGKTAMQEIVDGCNQKSDIIEKKTLFFKELERKGIKLEDRKDYYLKPKFNIEDESIIDEIIKESDASNLTLDDKDNCLEILRLFTKINVLRNGISNNGFENMKAIFISGKSLVQTLAHNQKLKVNDYDIPFATYIDYMTNKFWFKLKKGFGSPNSIPKSFDVITKAQIILSTQINNAVHNSYKKLKQEFDSGTLERDDAIEISYNLRLKSTKPEDVGYETLEDSLAFIDQDIISNHLKEKSHYKEKLREGELAKQKLRKIEFEQNKKLKEKFKSRTRNLYKALVTLFLIVLIIMGLGLIWFLENYAIDESIITIVSFLMALISLLTPIITFKKILKKFGRISMNYYSKNI